VTDREPDVTDHYALVRRVELLLERRRFDQARPMIGEGLRANPDSVELLYFSAFIDWVHDRNDDAQATVGRILSLDPENYAARILRGQILQPRSSRTPNRRGSTCFATIPRTLTSTDITVR
jgi:hypothetical protein